MATQEQVEALTRRHDKQRANYKSALQAIRIAMRDMSRSNSSYAVLRNACIALIDELDQDGLEKFIDKQTR